MPFCNGADRECAYATVSRGKPGRLPAGRSVRERWANQRQEAEQMTAARPLVRLLAEGCVGSRMSVHRSWSSTTGSPLVREGL